MTPGPLAFYGQRMSRIVIVLAVLIVAVGSSSAAVRSPRTVCSRGGQAVAPTAKQLRVNAVLCSGKPVRTGRTGLAGG